ncbi:Alpha/beta hydrolase family protein [Spirosomataceae bacterium TFI 002]|nr:Alpha/beta hydrolase family protein [Spirosomataceae bacterium TFI 002]
MKGIFLASIIFLSACSPTKKQFGQVVLENTADTTLSKQEILKIRSLDNAIFDSGTFKGKEQTEINYRLFQPKTNKKYPLVVVYHGSGRPVGTDNTSQLGILQKLFASPEIQNKYPAYVLAPQFPTRSSDYVMDSTTRNVLYSIPRPCLNSVLELIDSLKSNLNIDNNRIYVVGFSMGASTVINSLSARPELFAAGISISGIPQFDKIQELSAIPIWLIHGMDDTENPIDSDEQFYKEMNNSILFWKLKETTHDNVFTTTILGETLPKWLFKQHQK